MEDTKTAPSTYESDLIRAEMRDLRAEVETLRESIRYLNTTIFSLCVVGYAFYLYHTRRVH